MIIPSPEDTCTSSHTQALELRIFPGTVWHPRHLRQLNGELHNHFNPGNPFCCWKSSSFLPTTLHPSIAWIITSVHVVCQIRKHFQVKANLSIPSPPTEPFTQCDSHTAVTLEPQPRRAAGWGWRTAKWPFLELMWICLRLQWAWECYAVSSQPTAH